MKHKLFAFLAILCLAFIVRFYQLGSLPGGMTWDEAAIGYSAYGIATVHRDEWLNRTPISFRSFGDYKSALGIYFTSILMLMAPPSTLLVRIPIALAGLGLVMISYLIAQELFPEKTTNSIFLPLLVMLQVALSPWAILFSRVAFESMLATCLSAVGVYCFLRSRKKALFFLPSAVSFAASLYAYHSAKIVVPLICLILALQFRNHLKKHVLMVVASVVLAGLILSPFVYATFYGKANERALSTTILYSPEGTLRSPLALATMFLSNLIAHLDPSFLLWGKESTYRHSTQQLGILSPIEAGLILVALVAFFKDATMRRHWWIGAAVLVGFVPSALGSTVPHANRSLMALPWIQLLSGVGILWLTQRMPVYPRMFRWFPQALVGFTLIFGSYFCWVYYQVYSRSPALKELQYGYEEAVQFARSQESSVSHVYFTNSYGQAYIYLLFFKRLNPIEYRGGALANYVITDSPWKDAQGKSDVLVVSTPEEMSPNPAVIKEVYYPDGSVAFRIAKL